MKTRISIAAIVLVLAITGLSTKIASATTDTYYGYYDLPYSKFGFGSLMKLQAYSELSLITHTSAKCFNKSTANTYVLRTGIYQYYINDDGSVSMTNSAIGSYQAVPPVTNGHENYIEELMVRHHDNLRYYYRHFGTRYGTSNPAAANTYNKAEEYIIVVYNKTNS